jgi:hypothetical protein
MHASAVLTSDKQKHVNLFTLTMAVTTVHAIVYNYMRVMCGT